MGRFCRDQPSLLEQLVDQLRHEAVSHSIVPLPVAEAADFKVFRNVQRNRSGDVEIGSLGSALLQDEGRDLLPLGLQCGAVFLPSLKFFRWPHLTLPLRDSLSAWA